MFSVSYTRRSIKFLRSIDLANARCLKKVLDSLDNHPRPRGVIPIKSGVLRIRNGSYRAIYDVDWDSKEITIHKIDKRSRVYK